ncbi:glycosyltransferase family 8 [Brachionus plicatilis]|uniref:Glycosyltransferase family 8 n=1 Tax=Brachionus plicatilis TaxID=10195 RepID=A0A3M7RE57_BRAPC|nr:glycosyltransferase family 8 [Brachionus plicatilis]
MYKWWLSGSNKIECPFESLETIFYLKSIFQSGMRTTSEETVLLIKSILLKRTSNIVLNIATDEESKIFLKRIFENEMVVAYPRLTERCDNLKIPIVHHPGLWGMSKLFLDEIFPATKKTIYIDTDMILGSDPILLYNDFKNFDDETIFSLTRETNWKKGPTHICSCIFLWDMEKSRNTHLLKKKGLIAAKTVYGYEKNNKYFTVKNRHGELNSSWNLSNCRKFFGVKPRNKHNDRSGLFFGAIHFNCLGNNFTQFSGWEWIYLLNFSYI